MRKLIALLAAVAALTFGAVGANAGLVADRTAEGSGTQSINIALTDTTTRYVLGVATAPDTAVEVTYSVICDTPANSVNTHTFNLFYTASQFPTGALFALWTGAAGIGSPWHGWDTCSLFAQVNADFGDEEGTLKAWVSSHNGNPFGNIPTGFFDGTP